MNATPVSSSSSTARWVALCAPRRNSSTILVTGPHDGLGGCARLTSRPISRLRGLDWALIRRGCTWESRRARVCGRAGGWVRAEPVPLAPRCVPAAARRRARKRGSSAGVPAQDRYAVVETGWKSCGRRPDTARGPAARGSTAAASRTPARLFTDYVPGTAGVRSRSGSGARRRSQRQATFVARRTSTGALPGCWMSGTWRSSPWGARIPAAERPAATDHSRPHIPPSASKADEADAPAPERGRAVGLPRSQSVLNLEMSYLSRARGSTNQEAMAEP